MYPVNIKLSGLPCLVIGGGHVALRKIGTLLEEEADVTVMAPEVCEGIQKLAEEHRISWIPEVYDKGKEDGFFLVISASGNKEAADFLSAAAKIKKFLYNSADFPKAGNCHIPARLKKGSLMISISTEGRSPAMAKYMKNRLSRQIPEGYDLWLDRISRVREELKSQIQSGDLREKFWQSVFDEPVMKLVTEGKLDEAEECVRRGISGFRS